MITNEEYNQAVVRKGKAQEIIDIYNIQEREVFNNRLKSGQPFIDAELTYSRSHLCPCGYGLAYPSNCDLSHYWDCSAILKGIANPDVKHCGQLPFVFYEIKSENDEMTTRGVFKPQK